MNMRGNSANLISHIGEATRPRITPGQSIDFEGALQSYMNGMAFARQQKQMQQQAMKNAYELETFQQKLEQQAQDRNREGLARILQYGG